jgi:hypothetical protein
VNDKRTRNPRPKHVLLTNRIGPANSEIFVANADGSGERKLFANRNSTTMRPSPPTAGGLAVRSA